MKRTHRLVAGLVALTVALVGTGVAIGATSNPTQSDAQAAISTLQQFVANHPDASPSPTPTVSPSATVSPSPSSGAVQVSALSVAPQTSKVGDPVTVTFTVTGNAVLQDLAAAVRDQRKIDDGQLDFHHFGAQTLAGSKTFTASAVEDQPGVYTTHVAFKRGNVWTHLEPQFTFTVDASPTNPPPTVAPSSDNPLGTIGARSGLSFNSGIWPLARTGTGASYTQTLQYAEQRRGKQSDINMAAQYNNSWADLAGLQVLDWLNAYPAPVSVLMLPPWPTGQGDWNRAAKGEFDAYYRQIGAQIVAKRPNSKTVLRFAWEANGDWYDWSIKNKGGAEAFKEGFARAVIYMRAGAAAKSGNLVIDYSIAGVDDKSGNGTLDPLAATYPGDAFVDVIGEDSYDDWQVTTSATTLAKASTLDRIYNFTQAHGKWMSLDEWGLHHTNTASHPDGDDNPAYIRAMFTWIKAHPLAWEQYFQDDADGNVNNSLFSPSEDTNPNGRAAYLQEISR